MLKITLNNKFRISICQLPSMGHMIMDAAHKETSALLRSTQHIVRRKHHVPVHGVPSTVIIVPNFVRYDAKTSLDY